MADWRAKNEVRRLLPLPCRPQQRPSPQLPQRRSQPRRSPRREV